MNEIFLGASPKKKIGGVLKLKKTELLNFVFFIVCECIFFFFIHSKGASLWLRTIFQSRIESIIINVHEILYENTHLEWWSIIIEYPDVKKDRLIIKFLTLLHQ